MAYNSIDQGLIELDDQQSLRHLDDLARLALHGSDASQVLHQGSHGSSGQEPINNPNDFSNLYFDNGAATRQHQQQAYMKARSEAAAIALAQYGERLTIYLSQMAGDQLPMGQSSVTPQNSDRQQPEETVDVDRTQHIDASAPAVSGSASHQQPVQAPTSSNKRRYTHEEEQIISTMMQASSTAKEVGQRLNRNPSSILLKWGRMRGRFGDPHAAEKRRRRGGE